MTAKTRAGLAADIATLLDNTAGDITPAMLRGVLQDMVDSSFNSGGIEVASLPLAGSGRLTLTSATPVMTGAVSAAGTVYFTPYKGAVLPIYDGTEFNLAQFAEMSNVLANSSAGGAGPAAAVASSVYDLFVWNNAGTLTLTRGPAWTSATARALALQFIQGVPTNAGAITNGPGTNLGIYVGTVATDSSGATVSWSPGSSAAGGGAATLNVWNYWQRVDIPVNVNDSTSSWSVTNTSSYAALDAGGTGSGLNNRISFVIGLDEDGIDLGLALDIVDAGGVTSYLGIGLDSATTPAPAGQGQVGHHASTNEMTVGGRFCGRSGIGTHYLQALQLVSTSSGATFIGGNCMVFGGKFKI